MIMRDHFAAIAGHGTTPASGELTAARRRASENCPVKPNPRSGARILSRAQPRRPPGVYAKIPAWGQAQSAPSPSPNASVQIHPDDKIVIHGQAS